MEKEQESDGEKKREVVEKDMEPEIVMGKKGMS